ncbi:MAG TPA: single-stranded DNA-binding protein [Arthrobacter sp.]
MTYNVPFIGNLVSDPKEALQTDTKSGTPRLNFRIGINSGERGTDSEKKNFYSFTAFGSVAENMAASLGKGDRVIVLARIDTFVKEVQIKGEDVNLTIPSFKANNVAPDLTWATAKVSKTPKKATNSDAGYGNEDAAPAAPAKKAPAKAAPAAAAAADEDDDF